MTGGRRWLGWAALAYAVIIAAVSLGLARLYTGAQERLDEALGQRLLAVAGSLAEMADAEAIFAHALGDTSAATSLERLRDRFAAVAARENLSEITLTDALDQVVILTTSPSQAVGAPNDYWNLDSAAVESAILGNGTATRLYAVEGDGASWQKSAHAPVLRYTADGSYVLAVITASGSPDFFSSLDSLRLGAWLTAAFVLLVLVLMGVFLWRINVALERYRASILRQENLAAMGRMTAGIAHEIRNPLGIIRGAGQHLQRVLATHGITDEVAEYIPDEVDRLDHILAGYLAFGAARDPADEVFDLGQAARRGAGLVAEEFAAQGVSLDLEPAAAAAPVRGDPRRLQQVVLNLLLNARDAMPDGGRISVGLARDAARVRLTVADEGGGLGDAPADKLFEPFWTTKEKGSGLGLAMSRRIVEDMGGTLDLRERADGPGAVAELVVPSASDPSNGSE